MSNRSEMSLKPKKNQAAKASRLLITVNVLGSAGPLRFLVYEDQLVSAVIDMALRSYSGQGRLPALGSDINNFLLYCSNDGSDAMSSCEKIGSRGARNFIMCKKQQMEMPVERSPANPAIARKGSGNWKTWINKSLSFKIASH